VRISTSGKMTVTLLGNFREMSEKAMRSDFVGGSSCGFFMDLQSDVRNDVC
jgi:hypothetical protein